MAKSAVGVFEDRNDAAKAIAALGRAGFAANDIRTFSPRDAEQARAILSAPRVDREHLYGGALAAGLASGFAGVLVAIGVFNFVHGSVGMRLLAAFIAFLAAAGLGAGLGAVTGMITGAGIPQEHLEYYVEAMKRGSMLVVVSPRNSDAAERAVRILWDHGAADIERLVESWHGLAYP